MSKAAIIEAFSDVDPLVEVATVTIKAANLREGMVLVDEFNCPVAGIDQRVKATARTGEIAFLTADLENGGWNRLALRPALEVKVMAAEPH